ncbi:MAG: head morphogenesis protein [Deltaproteobacteria bacterium]|nr:head morphogenesis protein [Deltaproteobacteria bacterium]
MPDSIPAGFSFPGTPPKEALDYFRHKGLKPGFDYRDVWREEHAYAFTVAKAMQIDVLTGIRAAVDKALAEGQTLSQFRKDLEPLLVRQGWWGRQTMTDPKTGMEKAVQLGTPRRLETIYRTNLRTARAAGQWQRMERTKSARLYLLYLLGPSKEHREEHVTWHGTLLPADDPWWETHMPPNGWGCKCHVRQVSKREADELEREGVADPTAPPVRDSAGRLTGHRSTRSVPVKTSAPPVQLAEWRNKRTGDVELLPKGITPGFDTNPGKLRLQSAARLLTDKLEGAPPGIAQVAIRDVMASREFTQWFEDPKSDWPLLRLSDKAADAIGARHRVAVMNRGILHKQKRHHPDLKIEDYRKLPELGEFPTVIIRQPEHPKGERVAVIRDQGDIYMAVVRAEDRGQATYVVSFRRASGRDVRRLLKGSTVLFGKWEE